ncbi:cyclin-dependent kinase 6-like isoform X1 [Hypanus sabinus]|uniref:cyclin-dependent kinase 6-like isoform X1 n=1 Tax=Hypanus sabinus TaxID=79690 RepID=UPI0028C49E8A|nr:cyclin-dependent kinase 6-like isoform X1 [Hypanus sabinus]
MENSKPVRYELLAEIGEGTYGKVYKARDLESNGKCVALKRIAIPRTPEGIPVNVIREVALLKHLELFDHPNIIRLFDVELVHQTDRTMKMTLVFELIEQDLAVFLSKVREPGLLQNKVKGLVHQLFRGLDFLHSNSVVHRDLKPENILVSNSGQVKLADFGLARMYTVNMALTPVVVTLWYRAPEVLLYSGYTTAVDIWSVGCIFAEILQLRPFFCGISEINQLQKIFDILGLPDEGEWPPEAPLCYSSFAPRKVKPVEDLLPQIDLLGKDLLLKCLCFSPGQRTSTHEALAHPYFMETLEHL